MVENKPKISVIVPVYHSERYLERCCRSLFSQTLDDFECLFILDGPSPEAERIISEVQSEYDSRRIDVHIIRHAENKGISYSRQEGHDNARGEYLFHCDSDDWLESDALTQTYELACKEKADLVFFDYIRHYESNGKSIVYSSGYVENGAISTMDGTLCNKLIRRELISSNAIRFPNGINWGEDLCMSVLSQIVAKKIAYLAQIFYHYCMHSNSFTTAPTKDKYLQLLACPQFIEKELQERQLTDRYSSMLLQMKFEVKEYLLIHPALRDIQQWIVTYPECHPFIWHFPSVPIYLKGVSWLAANHLSWFANVLLSCRDLIHRLRH